MGSIKTRLLLLTLTAVAATWAIAVCFIYFDARKEIDELLDAHLAQVGSLLLVQVSEDFGEVDDAHAPTHKYARQVVFQIWENGRTLRLHSANAPDAPLGDARGGFSNRVIDATSWRVYSVWDDSHRFLVHVGERSAVREHLAKEVAEHLLRPMLYALPLLALLLWVAVGRGFAPLARIARAVAQREPEALTPLDAARIPTEVAPLVAQLNRLFERVNALIDNQRRFTADAAHELRTPIAAIKAQAQVARGTDESSEKNRALDNVVRGCDHATHLVEQLLTLARLDKAEQGPLQTCALRALAAKAIADIAQMAYDADVTISLADGDEMEIDAIPGLLYILLRNLIDNAVRYSPPGTTVGVAVSRDADRPVVTVTDEGPGIPAEIRDVVFQRFHRVAGTGQSGTGLGLSIAKRIAELHRAELRLESGDNGRGLRATIRF